MTDATYEPNTPLSPGEFMMTEAFDEGEDAIRFTGPISEALKQELQQQEVWRAAWEWEDGGGFSIIGTWDPAKAREMVREYLLYSMQDHDEAAQWLPPLDAFEEGRQRWVSLGALNAEDESLWVTHPRWWFGRRRILLVSW